MENLPYEITNQIIQCFGKCFHYKDTVEAFLISTGLRREMAKKYREEPKYVWARHLLTELSESDAGRTLQRRILTELCKLRNLPDKDVPDRDAGLEALKTLKSLAYEHDLVSRDENKKSSSRQNIANTRTKIIRERNAKLQVLRDKFSTGLTGTDRQSVGYDLEDILKELFRLFEIDYKKSYRFETQQIDGHFKYEGFDYLVEARWRKDQPSESEVGGFQRKVETKLESTRGIFFSINGFRDEVVQQYNGHGANILFFTGEDLIHILEGRVDLRDALRIKIEAAAQYGKVYSKIFDA